MMSTVGDSRIWAPRVIASYLPTSLTGMAVATTLPSWRSTARSALRVARSSEPSLFQKSTTATLPASTSASSGRDGSPGAASSARPGLWGLGAGLGAGAVVLGVAVVVAPAPLAALAVSTAPLALLTSLARPVTPGAGVDAGVTSPPDFG